MINQTEWNSKPVSLRKKAAAVKEKAFISLWLKLIVFWLGGGIYSFFVCSHQDSRRIRMVERRPINPEIISVLK